MGAGRPRSPPGARPRRPSPGRSSSKPEPRGTGHRACSATSGEPDAALVRSPQVTRSQDPRQNHTSLGLMRGMPEACPQRVLGRTILFPDDPGLDRSKAGDRTCVAPVPPGIESEETDDCRGGHQGCQPTKAFPTRSNGHGHRDASVQPGRPNARPRREWPVPFRRSFSCRLPQRAHCSLITCRSR